MKVSLIDHSKHGEETIAQSAGLCYGKPNKDVTRIQRLKEHKHLATMRFAHVVLKVEDISIACHGQIVRSKHLDFLVESKRYVDASNRGFVMPEVSEEATTIINESYLSSLNSYTRLLELGVAKEDARSILPMNTMTSMYIAGNLQAWIDFLKLRVDTHAQKEVREVAIKAWAILIDIYPLVFSDLKFKDRTFKEWKEN